MSFLGQLTGSIVVAGTAGSIALDHGIFRRISARLDDSIYSGSTSRRSVALTFDDGPGPQTLALLDLLREQGVPATFFQCGKQVERYPEIARLVLAEGHQIGNHTWSHPSLRPALRKGFPLPSFRKMRRELSETQQILQQTTGTRPVFFRAPYGHRWVGLDYVCRSLGMRSVQWTVIGHDWEWSAGRIAPYVLDRVSPGAIICLHDGRDVQPIADISETLGALRILLPALRAQGYSFETMSGLMGT